MGIPRHDTYATRMPTLAGFNILGYAHYATVPQPATGAVVGRVSTYTTCHFPTTPCGVWPTTDGAIRWVPLPPGVVSGQFFFLYGLNNNSMKHISINISGKSISSYFCLYGVAISVS